MAFIPYAAKFIPYTVNQDRHLVGSRDILKTGVACARETECVGQYLSRPDAKRKIDDYGRECRWSWCSGCAGTAFLVL